MTGSPTVGKAVLGGVFTTYNGTTMPGVAKIFASAGFDPAAINTKLQSIDNL